MRVDSLIIVVFFFFKQKTAYEMRISDWSSDVCSSDLPLDSEAGQCRDARGILEYARQISIAAGLEHGCRDHRPTPLPAWRRWRQFVTLASMDQSGTILPTTCWECSAHCGALVTEIGRAHV